MTTNHLDVSEVDSYDYLIVGGGTAVSITWVQSYQKRMLNSHLPDRAV